MDAASLRFLAARLQLAYYPRGAVIVGPESGVVDRLYIVKQGACAAAAAAAAADVVLGAGRVLSARRAGRPARHRLHLPRRGRTASAGSSPAADFHALLERSARFRAFCTEHLAALVERSHRALRAEAARVAGRRRRHARAAARACCARAPVCCAPGHAGRARSCDACTRERIGSMVVVDAQRRAARHLHHARRARARRAAAGGDRHADRRADDADAGVAWRRRRRWSTPRSRWRATASATSW